ncbi:MAG: YlbF family regulator [Phycisphaerae bacterium]|nr:YlbF family regulator [Phycisphaerae bacterium]
MSKAILDMAKQLGQAMVESAQWQALHAARAALEEQKDVLEALNAFQQQAGKMQQAEQQGRPVEVADKQKFHALHDKLVASDVFKRYTAAEMEFSDLMRQVHVTLRKQVAEAGKG